MSTPGKNSSMISLSSRNAAAVRDRLLFYFVFIKISRGLNSQIKNIYDQCFRGTAECLLYYDLIKLRSYMLILTLHRVFGCLVLRASILKRFVLSFTIEQLQSSFVEQWEINLE